MVRLGQRRNSSGVPIYRGVAGLRRKHNAYEQGKRVVVTNGTLDA